MDFFDFTALDALISKLEKKKSVRPGSPPVLLNGHLGIWRTIRHNRMFLEFNGANQSLGRVLVGPPSFVGRKLDDVSDESWENLTPRSTLSEFKNTPVSENGIENLKEAIRNATGPEDTRRKSIESLNTHLQLVPVARSAGFSDQEIKDALVGKKVNEPLSNQGLKSVGDRRSTIGEVETQAGGPKTVGSSPKSPPVEGSLALDPEKMMEFDDRFTEEEKRAALQYTFDKLKAVKNDLFQFELSQVENKLANKAIAADEVRDDFIDLFNKYKKALLSGAKQRTKPVPVGDQVKEPKISEDRAAAEADQEKISNFVETVRAEVDKKVKEEVKRLQQEMFGTVSNLDDLPEARMQSIEHEILMQKLNELLAAVKNQQVRVRVQEVINVAQKSRGATSLRITILQLLHLLQWLRLLIPGL